MSYQWRRCVRLNEPLFTTPFIVFASLAALAFLLGLFREFTGLGYVTGLNDGYSWGLFKNWNVTALTALGSGGYAVAVLTWLLNQQKFHPIMRTALLTSFVGYGTGMIALGFDVGRPWNFLRFSDLRNWNPHSTLMEVAVCMTAYVILALDVENMPPFLERLYQSPDPKKNQLAIKIFHSIRAIFPFFCGIGIPASLDAPIITRRTDVSGGRASASTLANAAHSAVLFADGVRVGAGLRADGAAAEQHGVEVGLGR